MNGETSSTSATVATPPQPTSETAKRPLPKAQYPLVIRLIAGAVNSISKPARQKPGGERALQGGSQGLAPALVPANPEAALGAARVALDVIGAVGKENKTVALALGGVLLVGLVIFGVAKMTSRSRSTDAAHRQDTERLRHEKDEVDRYAALLAKGPPLQGPQFEGHRDPQHPL
jgi:hypothetical protein